MIILESGAVSYKGYPEMQPVSKRLASLTPPVIRKIHICGRNKYTLSGLNYVQQT